MSNLDDSINLTVEDDGSVTLVVTDRGVSIPAHHAIEHGSDPITIANTQVTGLGTMSTQAAGAVNITGGTIAGVTFTTATLSSPTINTPSVTGGTFSGATLTTATISSSAATLTGGTINGMIIGGSSAAAGTFTNLTVTGTLTLTTDLSVANGGTGASTLTGILQGNGTSAFTANTSSTAGQVLRCTGANTFAFGAVDLADGDAVTNALPVTHGGTGASTESAARTNLFVPAITDTTRWRSDVTALTGGASNALDSIDISNTTTWPTGSSVAFSVSGELYVYRLTATGAAESSPDVIRPDSYGGREWTLISDSGTLPVSEGGTGATTLTGILQGNGTSAFTANTSSTVGQVLRCTGSNTYAFGAVNLADTDAVTGILPIANGGTGATTAAGALSAVGVRSGSATLVNGTVTVSIPGLTSSSTVVASHKGPPVALTVYGTLFPNPGTDSLVIESYDAAGALEADDDNEVFYIAIL
jgi:hypothetical protein